MPYEVKLVELKDFKTVWSECAPLLEKTFEQTIFKTYTLQSIVEEVFTGIANLWIVEDEGKIVATFVTELAELGPQRIINIAALGGESYKEWAKALDSTMIEYCKQQNCVAYTAITRKGFSRYIPELVEDGVFYVREVSRG